MSSFDSNTTPAAACKTAALALTAIGALSLSPMSEVQAKAPACHDIDQYKVVELPFLPEVISPTGLVAGVDAAHHTVLWRAGQGAQALPVPEGFRYTEPAGITAAGAVVINATDAPARRHNAFIYTHKTLTSLPGQQTIAHGVSPTGLVLGEWVPVGHTSTDAVYWDGRIPHPLGLCCSGTLKAANHSATLVGEAYDAQGHYHATSWSLKGYAQTLGPTDTAAVAIHDSGHILVQAGRSGYLYPYGHGHPPEPPQPLQLSPRLFNALNGLNGCDTVIGGYGTDSDHYRAFRWTPGKGFQDLNMLLPANSGWTLESAQAINDGGEIVGRGDFKHDDSGFLLIPTERHHS